jgi:hypothetical protein
VEIKMETTEKGLIVNKEKEKTKSQTHDDI